MNIGDVPRSHMLLVWQWIPKVAWSSDWLLFKGRAAFLFIFLYFDKKVPRTSIPHACAMRILDSVCIVIIVFTILI